MISFNLRCSLDHEFEGWFQNSTVFETQREKEQITCPFCHDRKIEKALSTPMVASSKARDSARAEESRAQMTMMKQTLSKMRAEIKENCDFVGDNFAGEARKIYYGETKERSIYGRATLEESHELKEEGIEVTVVPWMEEEVEH